ncbi:amidohydrolase [Ruminococcaceae bacterium OttesenSCG-928-D13]|nr:amidohydrolase [Ruminococcaceae bacterium OttesenSCG-928-D13]
MDLILYGGKIVTMDPAQPYAQALAIQDGVIRAVGRNEDILPLARAGTRQINLGGRLLLPGFCDSHMHLLSYGYGLEKAALGDARSLDDLIRIGCDFLARNPDAAWIQGRGFNNDDWADKRLPTRHDLDRISTEIPISFTRICSHTVVVNSKALQLMGAGRGMPQPEGGSIEFDENGEPNGIFRDTAQNLVYAAVPHPTLRDVRRMLVNAGRDALRCGLTSVHTDDYEALTEREYPLLLDAYFGLAREGKLPVRVYEQCRLHRMDLLQDFLAAGHTTGQGDSLFKIGPFKLLCDGGLGARTALLSRPYADSPETLGHAVYTQDELDSLVATAHNAGMPSALHTIGDGSLDMCLDAIGRAAERNPRPELRHSVIHCQVTRPDQLRRLRDMGLIAHIQPIFIDYDHRFVSARLGAEREQDSYNWRTMADLGIHYACGSDSPVESFDVLRGIACAVTRMGQDGQPPGGWLPQQALTVEQAVYGYTMGGAYAACEERIKGSLTAGKLADMVVLDRDIFTTPPGEIKDAQVDMTVMGGALVWQRTDM